MVFCEDSKDINLSDGCLLTILDGAIGLPHGVIVFIICNNLDNFSKELKEVLFWEGRIDEKYEFTKVYDKNTRVEENKKIKEVDSAENISLEGGKEIILLKNNKESSSI